MSTSTESQEYVTLVSGDGFEFVLPRSTACVSGTIRRMLEPSSTFPSISTLSSRATSANYSGLNRQLLRSHHGPLRPRDTERSGPGESMRVFLLQPEEQGPGQCAGYGDSAGVVLGVVDGGGLSGYLTAWFVLLSLHGLQRVGY